MFALLTFTSVKFNQCMLVHVIKTGSKHAFNTEVHENNSWKASFMDAVHFVS